jgi:hypothetical protein
MHQLEAAAHVLAVRSAQVRKHPTAVFLDEIRPGVGIPAARAAASITGNFGELIDFSFGVAPLRLLQPL